MEFEDQLIDSSRLIAEEVAANVGTNQKLFDKLMDVAYTAENKLAMRASRAAAFCVFEHPHLFISHFKRVITKLPTYSSSVSKNFLWLFVKIKFDIPEKEMSKLLDHCYEKLLSFKETPAVRMSSLYILYNFSNQEPDFKSELIHVFSEALEDGSVGFLNSGKKTLNKLKKEVAKQKP